MIELRHLWKWYPTPSGRHVVLRDVHLDIPLGTSVGILGGNGAGKSTLLRLIGGSDFPDQGKVVRRCRVSWPLGLSGGFQGSLSGRENVRFVARIHGHWRDAGRIISFVHGFSELGDYFDMPVQTYSSGMRSRLGFALSMAFPFDVYLVDEVTSVGDAAFRRKAREAFADLRRRAGLIMVSHNLNELARSCRSGICLSKGTATVFPRISDALAHHKATLGDVDAA